uniref:HAUS augmin like complex subunit 6 n=1 Tax=Fundulus heteroclitus TaxID=8078 RepID=A0A3Q2R010_FUNHE
MANPTLTQRKNGQYLWFSLLGLGFQPEAAAASLAGKANIKYLILGPHMFDKPNKDAYYLVTHFLLEKLNPARFQEAYRHCWPVLDHKADAEFRKVTCAWLREIMDETANAGSKVVMSLFLSPGGPKFLSLMIQLASHVMLQDMKTFTTDKSWVPEAAAMPASTLTIAASRLNFTRTRFLKAAVDQDRFLHDYQRRAQVLVKSTRDLKAEGAKYDQLLKYVACVWWMFLFRFSSATSNGQRFIPTAVESVLKGDVDQYVLDGTNRVLKLPRCLLERIERLPHQVSREEVPEPQGVKSLPLLHSDWLQPCLAPHLSSRHKSILWRRCWWSFWCCRMSDMRGQADQRLLGINSQTQGVPNGFSLIFTFLDIDTVKIITCLTLALGFLSPMAPLSFEPAPEAAYRQSIFSQFPAKLLGEPSWTLNFLIIPKSVCVFNGRRSLTLQRRGLQRASQRKERTRVLVISDQFADAITTASPAEGRARSLDLEDLLSSLQRDPFSARKQLHRTPESLIMAVKGSWRKAVEEEEAKSVSPSAELNDSLSGRLSPVARLQSPEAPSQSASLTPGQAPPADQDRSSVCQQGLFHKSSLLWDTYAEAHDSPSGTGSSAVQFSLDQETLPEMPSFDSLNPEDDEAVDVTSEEEEEVLIPSLKQSLLTPAHRGSNNTEGLLSGYGVPAVEGSWLVEAQAAEEASKVFSLELDSLDSPQKKQDYGLPALITFSPIDDMKC